MDDLSGLFYQCCLNPVSLSLSFSFSEINVWRSMVRLTKWRHRVVIVAFDRVMVFVTISVNKTLK